ncbi:hypothetical protein ABE10_01590 [Bacillus toyonensis]|nr:hypothetical protein [Bacillus toyonensis]
MLLDTGFLASRVEGSAAGLGREDLRDETGDQVEDHHDDDQGEGRGPGAVDVCLRGDALIGVLRVDEDREGLHAAVEQVVVHRVGEPGGDQQRGRLSDHTRDREHDARRDAGDRGREDDFEDRQPLRHAERV